ncbi:class I SAM-dependent methyltransferase [Cellulomonas sp. ATA003]|uniref:class I SAM-dependent methyltransferase n=1 Tax=Cellulomonas sp. ATA003 TaxID=3073064 RepID=UPI00287303F5|nr:class I SAM-dependent methyltransferase [Cellulomonas sp. ATA003]WNB86940.1 class I SAM-dependent methyltransferase [Cellulomonas sp. ATA003]
MDRTPHRIRVAVDVVDPAPDARVLEIGCGPGVAMALLCERLPDGHVTGLDRSATAIARAERRLRRHLDAGRADLQHRELTTFHGDGRPYDVVLAVDVNAFWTGPAEAAASRLVDLLADDGVVHLLFAPPDGVDGHPAGERTVAALRHVGLDACCDVVDGVLCVTAPHRRPVG